MHSQRSCQSALQRWTASSGWSWCSGRSASSSAWTTAQSKKKDKSADLQTQVMDSYLHLILSHSDHKPSFHMRQTFGAVSRRNYDWILLYTKLMTVIVRLRHEGQDYSTRFSRPGPPLILQLPGCTGTTKSLLCQSNPVNTSSPCPSVVCP